MENKFIDNFLQQYKQLLGYLNHYFKFGITISINKVLLVTSKFHSLRSALIFRWALEGMDREVKVLSCPTPYDNFNAAAWWQSREDAKRVVMEYAKLVNFYLLDRWR